MLFVFVVLCGNNSRNILRFEVVLAFVRCGRSWGGWIGESVPGCTDARFIGVEVYDFEVPYGVQEEFRLDVG